MIDITTITRMPYGARNNILKPFGRGFIIGSYVSVSPRLVECFW
jgi:hypothetical protein